MESQPNHDPDAVSADLGEEPELDTYPDEVVINIPPREQRTVKVRLIPSGPRKIPPIDCGEFEP